MQRNMAVHLRKCHQETMVPLLSNLVCTNRPSDGRELRPWSSSRAEFRRQYNAWRVTLTRMRPSASNQARHTTRRRQMAWDSLIRLLHARVGGEAVNRRAVGGAIGILYARLRSERLKRDLAKIITGAIDSWMLERRDAYCKELCVEEREKREGGREGVLLSSFFLVFLSFLTVILSSGG